MREYLDGAMHNRKLYVQIQQHTRLPHHSPTRGGSFLRKPSTKPVTSSHKTSHSDSLLLPNLELVASARTRFRSVP